MKWYELIAAWMCLACVTGCGDLGQNNPATGTGSIQGTVVDTDDAPITGARVFLRTDLSAYVQTDQEGNFLLEDVAAGIHEVIAYTDAGMGTSTQATVFGDQTTTVELRLAPTGRIGGKVTLAGGSDHVGTLVYLPGTSFCGFTDHDGSFELAHVVPGCYRLRAEHTGFLPKELDRVCSQATVLTSVQEITLVPRGTECTSDNDCAAHQVCREGVCVFDTGYSEESCDGADNDGDGLVDEGVAEPCGQSEGACRPGISLCLGGTMSECLGGVGPADEVCDDGIDNDCDAETDEDCITVCGNGDCEYGEDACNCPQDCHEQVECCVDEDCPPLDGGPCYSSYCDSSRHVCMEGQKAPCCWNGVCEIEANETPDSCPEDCGEPFCGNDFCDADEDQETCPEDCGCDNISCACPDRAISSEDHLFCDNGNLARCDATWIEACEAYSCVILSEECPNGCFEPESGPVGAYCCPRMSTACTEAGWVPGSVEPFCVGPDLFECALACIEGCGCDEELVLLEKGAEACSACTPAGMPIPQDGTCCAGAQMLNSSFVPDNGSCNGSYCFEPVCAACGDGSCGAGENYCSCPEDCGGLTCVGEHGVAMEDLGIYDCCDGLIPVSLPGDSGCSQYMCVDCGDGVCGLGETADNCLADCGSCVEEGGWFEIGQGARCCDGLTLLETSETVTDGQCTPAHCGVFGICTRCGDGTCGIGESFCTCPQDCSGGCVQPGGVMVEDQGCCDGNPFVQALPLADEGCALYVCALCGDGSCDYGERAETCPADCAADCVPEGGMPGTDEQCCSGLDVLSSNFAPDAGVCNGAWCWSPVCAQCGDGACGTGENYCSCPEDCGEMTCVGEYGMAMDDMGVYDCCQGLIPVALDDYEGCHQYMCVDCGDGTCGPGESPENCPADCG